MAGAFRLRRDAAFSLGFAYLILLGRAAADARGRIPTKIIRRRRFAAACRDLEGGIVFRRLARPRDERYSQTSGKKTLVGPLLGLVLPAPAFERDRLSIGYNSPPDLLDLLPQAENHRPAGDLRSLDDR